MQNGTHGMAQMAEQKAELQERTESLDKQQRECTGAGVDHSGARVADNSKHIECRGMCFKTSREAQRNC